MPTDKEASELASASIRLARTLGARLAGLGPEVQGAVLADLVATYFSGFPLVEQREEAIELWLLAVRSMISIQVEEDEDDETIQ